MSVSQPWWRSAVFYEIYVRSFADGTADGVGDLVGIRDRLDHLVALGVDALWLTPFYPSPQADHGYDVADPRGVDPLFGTLADFDALLDAAHGRGLRVVVDVVPNHTSDRHPWFVEALAAGPGSAERTRYHFRPGRGVAGELPPNNWRSTFGGPAWTRVADGEWYLHLFAPQQPDLDWEHPDVAADYERTLRFWLDRGVDGFRIDVAHGLVKAAGLPDQPGDGSVDLMADRPGEWMMWDRPEVHEAYRRWRKVLDSYAGDRMAVGEVWLGDPARVARYVRPDELHQAFNFRLLRAPWSAASLRRAIDESVTALGTVGAPPTWVLSNHDVVRHVTRYGGGEVGRRRARAALLLVLALPGAAYLFQGEELGLDEVEDLPDAVLQDPVWERSGRTERGRDGCRVPLPWAGAAPPYGFGTPTAEPWLPMPDRFGACTVEAQAADPGSMLTFYRRALALRRSLLAGATAGLGWERGGDTLLDLRRPLADGELTCVVNFGPAPAPLPDGEVLLRSDGGEGPLPADTAAWVLCRSPEADGHEPVPHPAR